MNHLEEHVQDKNGEKWTCIDLMARNVLSNITISKIKCAARLNMPGDRIKIIDKRNVHTECPVCNQNESWEHMILCSKQKKNRKEWMQRV